VRACLWRDFAQAPVCMILGIFRCVLIWGKSLHFPRSLGGSDILRRSGGCCNRAVRETSCLVVIRRRALGHGSSEGCVKTMALKVTVVAGANTGAEDTVVVMGLVVVGMMVVCRRGKNAFCESLLPVRQSTNGACAAAGAKATRAERAIVLDPACFARLAEN
jgi:hypothetical protein